MTDPHVLRLAVLHTLPLYEMCRMRAATSPRRHAEFGHAGSDAESRERWVNGFTHTRRLLTPNDREVVSPNNDTLYTNAWLDLSRGPVLIETPEMGDRYWTLGFLDLWTNPFAYAGRRTTGNRPQRLFVHGPTWRGDVPLDAAPIAAPGADLWIIGRILVDPDPADIARVAALQRQFAVVRPDGGDAACTIDVGLDGRATDTPDAASWRRVVDAAWHRNPAPSDGAARADWTAAHEASDAELQSTITDTYRELRDAAAPTTSGRWSVPVTIRTGYGDDTLLRARVARNLIGALGIEEAMYAIAETDARGRPLDGAARYDLRFARGTAPEVDAFWSLTLYRQADCLLAANPTDRYSIGDRTPGLVHAADGSLRIRVQPDPPLEADVNWLPSPRHERFYLTLRLYQPRAVHLDFRYIYPPLVRLDDGPSDGRAKETPS